MLVSAGNLIKFEAAELPKLKGYSGHSQGGLSSAVWDHNTGLQLKAVWVPCFISKNSKIMVRHPKWALYLYQAVNNHFLDFSTYIKAISIYCRGNLYTYYARRPFFLDRKFFILSWMPFLKTGKEEIQQSNSFIVNNSLLLIPEKTQTIKISLRERKKM